VRASPGVKNRHGPAWRPQETSAEEAAAVAATCRKRRRVRALRLDMACTSGEACRSAARFTEQRPKLMERIQKPANGRKKNEKRGQPAPEILREW
jgi:hypothetical protein